MKHKILLPALTLSFLVFASCSSDRKEKPQPGLDQQLSSLRVSEESVQKYIADWPEASKEAASDMMEKYGLPEDITEKTLVWYNTAPFKRTTVTKEEVTQFFPVLHSDVLIQTVDYKVPSEKVTDLFKFDGSLIIDRTKGEISARNDQEAMNILALNLAHQIVQGGMTVKEARREYSANREAFRLGNTNQYTSGLRFVQTTNTGDPDVGIQAPKMQAQEAPESQEAE
jgi:hypothetical protein